MRMLICILFFAATLAAQTPARLASACGERHTPFDLDLDKSAKAAAQTEAGKGLIYFIQDNGMNKSEHYTLQLGLDGNWVGAYKARSYLAIPVAPGLHHLCVQVQSNFKVGHYVELRHVQIEAGQVYYFRTRLNLFNGQAAEKTSELIFEPLDSDQAEYMLTNLPRSVAKVQGKEASPSNAGK